MVLLGGEQLVGGGRGGGRDAGGAFLREKVCEVGKAWEWGEEKGREGL